MGELKERAHARPHHLSEDRCEWRGCPSLPTIEEAAALAEFMVRGDDPWSASARQILSILIYSADRLPPWAS